MREIERDLAARREALGGARALGELLRHHASRPDVRAYLRVRAQVVADGLCLVDFHLRRLGRIAHVRGVPLDDLRSAGHLGLVIAADRLEPQRASYQTYANLWVRHHMQRCLFRRQLWVVAGIGGEADAEAGPVVVPEADGPDPDDAVRAGRLRDALGSIDSRLAEVLVGRLGGDFQFEIAARMGVTANRISQLEAEGVTAIRRALRRPRRAGGT